MAEVREARTRMRWESWTRRKAYLGLDHPAADASGYEKWPRFGAEFPPELEAEMLETAKRLSGLNRDSVNRASVVRMAVGEWLERHSPDPEPAVDAEAVEMPSETEGAGDG